MKASKMLIGTLKEAPNEAVISSHILLIRAGMIRKLVSGVYNYLPLGLRTLNKIENVIREEMDKAGSLEILSSALQPKEFWVESGRWQKYGPELMRLKDRNDREFCLGPTHEEIFTDLVRNEIKSRKALPINIYQIQTKYRDELRPRFGLMRSREFIMKDAYSFDVDEAGLNDSYQNMYKTYERIFNRFDINYKVVLADTGAIGGSGSHQFMALSDVGESNILYCDCGYAADEEKATSRVDDSSKDTKLEEIKKIETPHQKTIEDLSKFLEVDSKKIIKAVSYVNMVTNELVVVLVRGDKEVNEIKVVNKLNIAEHELRFAGADEISNIGSCEGFIGPVNLKGAILLVDEEVTLVNNAVCGANEANYHLMNVNYNRDFTGLVGDYRKAQADDLCPVCGKKMKLERGIELGQIFKLGTKYSEPMKCTFHDEDGKEKPMIMGCYGIGVTRTLSSIIEQHHDEFGIKWPLNVAPYHAVIVPINYDDEVMKNASDFLYEKLLANGVEVILDDRDAKPGFKFKDWELIGIPYIVTIGRRANERICEFKMRSDMIKVELDFDEAANRIIQAVKSIK